MLTSSTLIWGDENYLRRRGICDVRKKYVHNAMFFRTIRVSELQLYAFVESGNDIWKTACEYKIFSAFGIIVGRNIAHVATGVLLESNVCCGGIFKGRRSDSVFNVEEAVMIALKIISSNRPQLYFQQLYTRQQKYIVIEGD